MKNRLIVFTCFLLGVLVIVTRLFHEENGSIYRGSVKENVITVLLLVVTWGTVIYVTRKHFIKNK